MKKMSNYLKSPFPWFGGKSVIAGQVWEALGDVVRYIEPFFGSGAVLLNRPQPFSGREVINDKDGYIANFWRSIAYEPDIVAYYANWPVNENDLHARNAYVTQLRHSFTAKLEGNPEYFDAKVAGWWLWGICASIGNSFANAKGPWTIQDGLLVNGNNGQGINRGLPHMGDNGQGIYDYMRALHDRIRHAWVCCGEWHRITGPSVTFKNGITGVFLDPPYPRLSQTAYQYAVESTTDRNITADVRQWCIENGDNPLLRIILCGYDGIHNELEAHGWRKVKWKAESGYAHLSNLDRSKVSKVEAIWLSPHCLYTENEQQIEMFNI